MAVIDDKIKALIASHGRLKTVLTVLFAALSFGKGKGWFQKEPGVN